MSTCKRYNFHHIKVHVLNHSNAIMLVNKGVDALIISEKLGHINPTTTLNTYSHSHI
ncbi:tyrosine-type recombinase/integrase [Peptostreptococcus stomatis]|uniref:tyrosine-type recombinase/integrase n=1 Tax=Peptostreptococcus stomatis TaxID=341694 RepID=UPI003FA08658